MLLLALMLQVASFAADTQHVDSTYSSPQLRDFIAAAVAANRAPPPALASYRADLESELSLILRDSLGRETVGEIEQVAAVASWQRAGDYDLHIVGYRSQSMGVPYSALTFARMWTVPTLYGNRLFLGMNDGVPLTPREAAAWRKQMQHDSATGRAYHMVHPLADDRDGFYRFSGGDTVATITSRTRTIRLLRVMVEPVAHPGQTLDAFRGELDFDAERHQLVRMRGRVLRLGDEPNPLFVRSTGAVAVAYVEYENAEVNGEYWLPAFERSEFQAQMGILGETRPVFRLVSRFRNYRVIDTGRVTDVASDSALPPTHARITYATHDSVSRFGPWQAELGAATSSVRAGDFDDMAPDAWRATGRPRMNWWPRRMEDVLRYDRVEGLFTGAFAELRFRDAAPGLSARASVGWAWTEQTVRGSGTLALSKPPWLQSVRAERDLATTNDFLLPAESGLSIGPLLTGLDRYDFVDRRLLAYALTRVMGSVDRGLVTIEGAVATDAPERARLTTIPLHHDSLLPNRNAFAGRYGRITLIGEYHPRVTGDALASGLGARVQYQLGHGDLDWQRVDARLAVRGYRDGMSLAARIDAGALFGHVLPPQQLFELGGSDMLPSYGYKEFGGDRAAVGRGLVAYYFPIGRTPRRVWRFVVPGLSPGVGLGAQSGWAEASTPAARQALLALGGDGITPLSRPTDGVRATVDLRFTILSGAVGGGIARAVDHPDAWKPFFGFGLSF